MTRSTYEKVELFALYYNELSYSFNKLAYDEGIICPDEIEVRLAKFRKWLYTTYTLKLAPNDNWFTALGAKQEKVAFDDPDLEEQFFKEAEHARTLHLLKN